MEIDTLRKYLMNSTVCYGPSDTAATDGSTDTSTTDDTNKNDDKNNQDNKFDFTKSIWQDDVTDTSDKDDDDKNKKTSEFDPDKDKRASEFVNQHIQSLGLLKDVDFESMLGEDGLSTDNLKKGFERLSANMYMSFMRDSSKVTTNKIEAAVKRAVTESTEEINTTTAYRRMEERLPATKNPNIAPIAQQALNKFRAKGQTLEEGIDSVKKFLKATADEVTNTRADDEPPPRRPGSGQFGVNQPDATPPVEDWEVYLRQ